jgi:hypothetical protein
MRARLADEARRVFTERFAAEKVYGDMRAYLSEVCATAGSFHPGGSRLIADSGSEECRPRRKSDSI